MRLTQGWFCVPKKQSHASMSTVDGVSVVEEEGLVCTVGRLAVWPGASNVIAGRVNLTVDIRSRQDAVRKGALRCVAWLPSWPC